jgi:hypothetical protein
MRNYHFQVGLVDGKNEQIVSIHYKLKGKNKALSTNIPMDASDKRLAGCKDMLIMGMKMRGWDNAYRCTS